MASESDSLRIAVEVVDKASPVLKDVMRSLRAVAASLDCEASDDAVLLLPASRSAFSIQMTCADARA
jgi:hypothetical protein